MYCIMHNSAMSWFRLFSNHSKVNCKVVSFVNIGLKITSNNLHVMQRIRIALLEVAVNVEMRRVRLVAPEKWMLCASFTLPKSVAFANTAVDT